MKKNNITLGILAHVDAGKTTLSEGILYETSIIRTIGRVDHGDAFLDTYKLEKDRGITIFSKQANFNLGDKKYTLLDTPGHMDFSAEMERTLGVLDYAILLVSAPDGITGQVDTLWKLLKLYEIPTFIFVNKMDQSGTDLERTMNQLKSKLSEGCVSFDALLDESNDENQIYDTLEKIALCDEETLEIFLETGNISDHNIIRIVEERKIFPVFSGSALKNFGVKELLHGISKYTESPDYPENFGARVYKITRDENGNRLTHIKVTGGSLTVKEQIIEEKINQIRVYNGSKYENVNTVSAGEVCCVTGLTSSYSGQGLGIEEDFSDNVIDSILSYDVILNNTADVHSAFRKFSELSEEIPELHVEMNPASNQISIKLMGEIQAEIIKNIVQERFNLDIDYSQGKILYKETLLSPSYGVGHYEPLKHYAEVHLILEPLPLGSGMVFETSCSEDVLDKNWQRLIMTHLLEREHKGVLTGSPITDIKISIATGKAHNKHTEGGDFRQATYRAIGNGLRRGDSVLLEPYYEFNLEIPTECVGRAMSDIQKMSGNTRPLETSENSDFSVLTGLAPVATMTGYQREVISYTKGMGTLTLIFAGYRKCHNQDEVISKIGYNIDSDQENPTGSIFCSHGSGEFVPWNEVASYMHLSQTKFFESDDKPVNGGRRNKITYSDNDLQSIFEMTYGKSKREKNPFKRSARIVTSESFSGPKVQSGYNNSSLEEILLIDGYNMIFAWYELKEMSKLSLESARNLLIDTLRNYHGYTGTKTIVVFDAYKQPRGTGYSEKYEDITVVFTKENETADQYIEKFVLENVKKYRITVATSDGLEQIMIFGQGALRMPARELRAKILESNEKIKEQYLNKFH